MPTSRPPKNIEYVTISLKITRQFDEMLENNGRRMGKSKSQLVRDAIARDLLDRKAA